VVCRSAPRRQLCSATPDALGKPIDDVDDLFSHGSGGHDVNVPGRLQCCRNWTAQVQNAPRYDLKVNSVFVTTLSSGISAERAFRLWRLSESLDDEADLRLEIRFDILLVGHSLFDKDRMHE